MGRFLCVIIFLFDVNGEESPRGDRPFPIGFQIDEKVSKEVYVLKLTEPSGYTCVVRLILILKFMLAKNTAFN